MEEKIIFSIEFVEDEIQSFAEANFGRELTELELNRLKCHWYEDDRAYWARTELLAAAIEMVTDTKKRNFDYTDKTYLASIEGKK